MTVEEVREALKSYCQSREACSPSNKPPCPLLGRRGCYICEDEEYLRETFKILCRSSDYKGPKETEAVDHPAHYQGKHECIDEMIALFGAEAVKHFCMCNVYKYRFRAANKNGQEDISKAEWYMDKLMELEAKND